MSNSSSNNNTLQNRPKSIEGLGDIAGFYDGVILDLWGVVHDGIKPFEHTIDTLQELKRSKRIVWLLSNAPRRASVVSAHLETMGITPDLYDGIITSGEATWHALKDSYIEKWGNKCFHLGPERDNSVHEGLPLELVKNVADADFILNSGIYDHINDTAEQYAPLLEEAAAKNIPMICANPDRVVHVGHQLVLCPGTLADMYEKLDGQVVWFGKPYRSVYSLCLQSMGVRKVIALGDSMMTDIAGAAGAGIDSALVMSGIHRDALFSDTNAVFPDENRLHKLLAQFPYRPQYLLQGFKW